jgi:toxin ParE1/3/4
MKVRYTDTAAAEIRDITSYISAHNPTAADAVLAQIEHTIELLAGHPMLGPIKYEGSVRMLPVRHYPQYLLFYTIEQKEIVVLNLRHAARRRPWRDDD